MGFLCSGTVLNTSKNCIKTTRKKARAHEIFFVQSRALWHCTLLLRAIFYRSYLDEPHLLNLVSEKNDRSRQALKA